MSKKQRYGADVARSVRGREKPNLQQNGDGKLPALQAG